MPTGIAGLDEITHGGLPRGRATLVAGGAGCGKTVLALQTLVHGARALREPGIFVAFEESATRIVANAATFGWNLTELQRRRLFFLDAQPPVDAVATGSFDLQGLLAALDVKIRQLGAQRLVFDSIDVVLSQLKDPLSRRREAQRLHEWLLDRGITTVITAKAEPGEANAWSFLQFMFDCALELSHVLTTGFSQRGIQVVKFRGSSFAENSSPLVIADNGIEIAGITRRPLAASNQRVSTGIERLDSMLHGGYFRGSSVLITGSPGTAKTTLCGAFACAAGLRGERMLYASFDSEGGELVRNLSSVGLNLARLQRRGLLHVLPLRTMAASAEVHWLKIRALARELQIRCLVIDPISALANPGNELTAHSVAERLIDWAKGEGITVVCASLLERNGVESECSPLQISTIADTWIHLSYGIHAGERNRALTIVKSRGTEHSHQVRELLLHRRGVSLNEVSSSHGQMLMGTMRWQQEQADRDEQTRREMEFLRQRLELEAAEADLRLQVERQRHELARKQAELRALLRAEGERLRDSRRTQSSLRQLRGGDRPGEAAARPERPLR